MRPTFAEACRRYGNRYTQEHVPAWAVAKAPNGKSYAPQYATDQEWYDNTTFPGEPAHEAAGGDKDHCMSRNPSWPLGRWLEG